VAFNSALLYHTNTWAVLGFVYVGVRVDADFSFSHFHNVGAQRMYLGLVLFFITFVILSLSKLLLAQLRKGEGSKT
jgi:hypothetical protein